MKPVEQWRWRYVDPTSGATVETNFHLTPVAAQRRHPGAQRVPGTLLLAADHLAVESYEETVPAAFYRAPD